MSFPYPKITDYDNVNITSREVITSFKTNIYSENKTEEKIQDRREQELLKAVQVPNIYIETLNLRAVHKLLGQDFYQYNVMEGVMYASEELLIGKSTMETAKKVHQSIGKLVELASGANGTVSTASIGDKIDPNDDDLMHEAFVGLAGTNKLRKDIPNFSFIYGAFKCDGPIMPGKGKEVKTFCTGESGSPVTYALYENIVGKTFYDQIDIMTGPEFINIYLQVLLAINYADLKCDFTHFDLHWENVILRKLENITGVIGVKYPTQGLGDIYMYTNVIPTIIDYGYTHIKYKGNDYGHYIVSSLNSFKSFPLHDAYKFLMFAAFGALEKANYDLFETCEVIYKFFSDDDLAEIIVPEREAFFQLPDRADLRGLSIEPLILFITENLETELQVEPLADVPLLECATMCLRPQDVKQEIAGKEPVM
jgi:hypothetical protein